MEKIDTYICIYIFIFEEKIYIQINIYIGVCQNPVTVNDESFLFMKGILLTEVNPLLHCLGKTQSIRFSLAEN